MHRLPITLAGLTLVFALSAPAWAETSSPSQHHRFSGRSDSGSAGGVHHGDDAQHDDGTVLF